jgi:hypothetical protein
MLIGLGGGAASSMATGTNTADLDFASVQRGNPRSSAAPGSHRPLLAARRRQPDPVDPRRRRRRPVERLPELADGAGAARVSSCAKCRSKSRA